MSALRELIATFWVSADTRQLEEADKKVEGFIGALREAAEAVAVAFGLERVKEFVESQIEVASQLDVTANRLGTTAGELQSMQLAASLADVSAEALGNSMRFLNLHLAEASKGSGEAAQLFRETGIAIKNADGSTRAAGDVLADLADHIASIDDPARQTQLAMKLLGRGGAELIPLLKQGGAAFDEARAKVEELGGGISEGFIAQAKQAEDAGKELTFAMGGLKSQIAGALLPVALKLTEWFKGVVVQVQQFTRHTNVLSTGLTFFGTVAAAKALKALVSLGKEFGLIKPSILQTAAAMLRFALPLVLVGLLYLAFDELYNLLKGNDTLIGRALGPDKQAFVNDLRGAIDSLSESFGSLGAAIGSDGTAMGTFTTLVVGAAEAIAKLVEWGAKAVEILRNITLGLQVGGKLGWKIATGNEVERNLALGEYQTSKIGEEQGKALDRAKEANYQDELAQYVIGQKARDKYQAEHPGYVPGGVGPPATAPILAPPQVLSPSFVGPPGPSQITVQQQNETKVDVHLTGATEADAKAVGSAVGAGVSTAQQRANDRARTAWRQP